MIITKTTVGGIQFIDYTSSRVTNTVSDNNLSSNFEMRFDSPYGRHKTDFHVGDEVKIYADKDATPTSNIFTGIIDNLEFEGRENEEYVNIRGRDYTSRLMDNTVNPVVFTNAEVSTIVNYIVTNNLTDIGSANVKTTNTTLKRIAFNQIPIYDAIKQLADLSNYQFYVDNNKGLHFEPIGSITSNLTFNSGNIISSLFDKTKEGMANKIWVYGDRYLTGFKETFSVGSPNSGGVGSVFTLNYKPHNTYVEVLGSPRVGGIWNMVSYPISGTNYYVVFDDRKLIFPSGTTYGYFLPPSGGSIVVSYDRDLPIVKYGENKQSIQLYGPKTLVVNDKSIKDPNTATSILNEKITDANPLNNVELKLRGWFSGLSPGQIANINIPDFNLTDTDVNIIEMNYEFDPQSCFEEKVLTLKLDKKAIDLTDKIREIKQKIDKLESQDKQSTDTITRLEYGQGQVQVIGSHWEIRNRWVGSAFTLWPSSPPSPKSSGGAIVLGLLLSGTTNGAGSDSYLASSDYPTNPLVIIRSGGYANY